MLLFKVLGKNKKNKQNSIFKKINRLIKEKVKGPLDFTSRFSTKGTLKLRQQFRMTKRKRLKLSDPKMF